jgi:hypothetical protein
MKMRVIFSAFLSRRRMRLAALVVVGLAVGGGVAYATIPSSSDGTITGCYSANGAKANGGTGLNIVDSQSASCSKGQTPVQWNQQGPQGPPGQQGPPGNTDSTVRHMSNFMFDGKTVSTPVSSGLGQLGNLSLSCGSDAGGGFGTIGYTSTNSSGFQERLIFWSPEIPGTPTFTIVNGSTTIPWSHTPNDNILFQIMLEGLTVPDHNGTPRPSLTVIHGFVQEFPQYGGCAFYLHVDTSDVNSPETYSP